MLTARLQCLTIKKFPDPTICPVEALYMYLKRTLPFRGCMNKVFIILDQNPRLASKQTLSRWTKNVLEKAGLGSFTVHSGRAAASTCALLLGLPIDVILKQAGWKSKSTFVKHYMRTPLILSEKLKDKHNFSSVWQDHDTEKITNRDDEKIRKFVSTHSNKSLSVCSSHWRKDGQSLSTCKSPMSLCPSTSVLTLTVCMQNNSGTYSLAATSQGSDWMSAVEKVVSAPPIQSVLTWVKDTGPHHLETQMVMMMDQPQALATQHSQPPQMQTARLICVSPSTENVGKNLNSKMQPEKLMYPSKSTENLKKNLNSKRSWSKKPDRNYCSGWPKPSAEEMTGTGQIVSTTPSMLGHQGLVPLATARPSVHVGIDASSS